MGIRFLTVNKICFKHFVLLLFCVCVHNQYHSGNNMSSKSGAAVVRHCIRRQYFILLPNVWVVFKIYFAILHKIVAINNVQQRIRLNKQKEKNKVFVLLHYFRLAMLHIRVICFQHMAAWKRLSDMRKMCGNIFEDRNVQLNSNVHRRFSQIFRLYDDIYIGIC